jgi:23S rRNA U2552 (ribose-2'-O)-methylase RlmE/FtsJ
MALAP